MSWIPIAPEDKSLGTTVLLPIMFNNRLPLYVSLLAGHIDQMTSDPRTLDILCNLIAFTEPQVVVEVGTYRGIGTAAMAETLKVFDVKGHIWTCDPVDYDVADLLQRTDLESCVTFVQGTFEYLIPQLPSPMNFCYIDASAKEEEGLRLRYAKLALENMAAGGIVAVDDAAADWKGAKTLRRMADIYLPQHRGLALLVK